MNYCVHEKSWICILKERNVLQRRVAMFCENFSRKRKLELLLLSAGFSQKLEVQGEWLWVGGRQWGASSIRPKFPEIPVQNRMEQKVSGNSFGKFQFTSRGCPFFWKFGNSRKFLFHLAFLPSMNQSEFLYSWKATRWGRVFRVNTAPAAKWSAIVRACSWSPILHKNVWIWFPGKLWTGHFEFPVGQFAPFKYSPTRKVHKFLS